LLYGDRKQAFSVPKSAIDALPALRSRFGEEGCQSVVTKQCLKNLCVLCGLIIFFFSVAKSTIDNRKSEILNPQLTPCLSCEALAKKGVIPESCLLGF